MTRVRAGSEGFATVTAVMLCAGLAVVSVALIDLGLNSEKRARAEVERERERQALRSAIAETAADLANLPTSGLGSSVKQYDDLKVEVTVTNELARANVYHASDEQLAAALQPLADVDVAEIAAKLIAVRASIGSAKLPLEDFLSRLEVDSRMTLCLQERLTVHASSVDPFAAGGENPTAKDGAILNLRARIVAGRPFDRIRESIVVVTGDRQSPLVFLGNRTFQTSKVEECVNDKV